MMVMMMMILFSAKLGISYCDYISFLVLLLQLFVYFCLYFDHMEKSLYNPVIPYKYLVTQFCQGFNMSEN